MPCQCQWPACRQPAADCSADRTARGSRASWPFPIGHTHCGSACPDGSRLDPQRLRRRPQRRGSHTRWSDSRILQADRPATPASDDDAGRLSRSRQMAAGETRSCVSEARRNRRCLRLSAWPLPSARHGAESIGGGARQRTLSLRLNRAQRKKAPARCRGPFISLRRRAPIRCSSSRRIRSSAWSGAACPRGTRSRPVGPSG